jgi:ribonuclease Z
MLVEVGNPERDLLAFDLGSGSIANYVSLKLPVNKLNKVFLTHLHADHTADLITLSGSYSKVGRADGPVYVWGPSGTEPRLGTRISSRGSNKRLPGTPQPGPAPSTRTA